MKGFSLLMVSCLIIGSGLGVKRSDIENQALITLIGILNDSTLYEKEDILLPIDFKKDMMFFREGNYYSNGKLCLITEPEDIFDKAIIGSSRNILTQFYAFRDSISESSYLPKVIELPQEVKRIGYQSYLEVGEQTSYFFTVRQHLKAQNVSLVQIHLVPCEKAENPFEYTFYIYFDGDKVVNWNVSLMGDFEYDIDC